MHDVITDAAQATPDWFTKILQKRGCLNRGTVTSVEEKPGTPGLAAHAARLELSYSDDVPESVPSQFYLKFSRSDVPSWLGKKEVAFYTTVAPAMDNPPAVCCYDALYVPETGNYHILLEDLSETHGQTEFPLPPFIDNCRRIMDAMAEFHGAWWNHPRLGENIGQFPDETRFFIQDIEDTFPGFVDFAGDRLSSERRGIYEQVIESLPNLWDRRGRKRLTKENALTLTHGDAHFWSFLYPHDPATGRVHIIDWQTWGIGIGTDDLALHKQ